MTIKQPQNSASNSSLKFEFLHFEEILSLSKNSPNLIQLPSISFKSLHNIITTINPTKNHTKNSYSFKFFFNSISENLSKLWNNVKMKRKLQGVWIYKEKWKTHLAWASSKRCRNPGFSPKNSLMLFPFLKFSCGWALILVFYLISWHRFIYALGMFHILWSFVQNSLNYEFSEKWCSCASHCKQLNFEEKNSCWLLILAFHCVYEIE